MQSKKKKKGKASTGQRDVSGYGDIGDGFLRGTNPRTVRLSGHGADLQEVVSPQV